MNAEPMYTPKEVAALFRVGPVQVVRWAKEGKLRSVRTPGGQYRFPCAVVDALLAGDEPGKPVIRAGRPSRFRP